MQYVMCVRFPTVEDVHMSSVHLHQKCHHSNSGVVVRQVTGVAANNETEVVYNYCVVTFVVINIVSAEMLMS